MSLAREINEKLDKIIAVQHQISEIENDLAPDAKLNNIETGEVVTKEFVLNKGREELSQIKKELNKLTNNGESGRDLFTNPYYINDLNQDKIIRQENYLGVYAKLKKEPFFYRIINSY